MECLVCGEHYNPDREGGFGPNHNCCSKECARVWAIKLELIDTQQLLKEAVEALVSLKEWTAQGVRDAAP